MNFLGVGPLELLIVGALAYFLLGPKKMGEAGKSVGKILREFRDQRDEFTSMLMDSVDTKEKPESAATPSTPTGAVPQSGDPGDPNESDGPGDPDEESKSADSSDEQDNNSDREKTD